MIPLLLVSLLLLIFLRLVGKYRKVETIGRFIKYGLIFLAALTIPLLILGGIQTDPYYAHNQFAYKATLDFLHKNIHPNDLVLIDAYNQPIWYFYANFSFFQTAWIGLPREHYSVNRKIILYPEMDKTIKFIQEQRRSFNKIWLVTEKKEIPAATSYKSELLMQGYAVIADETFYQAGQSPVVNVILFD